MEKLKILLVEDDEFAAELIYDYFLDCGFSVVFTFNATDALDKLENNDLYDIVILDINLPDMDGFEIIKRIQNRQKNIPVIITSAYSDKNIKLRAFRYGASDYMTKPIDLEELEARVWVHLKKERHYIPQNTLFEIQDRVIFFQGKKLDLTASEFAILKYFIENKNRIVQREELSQLLSLVGSQRSLDNHIKNIRKKIGESSKQAKYLQTIYGSGYFFDF